MRTIEIVHRALLAVRSPPRLRRCRMVFPEDASNGLAPHNAANAASLRSRLGLSPAVTSNVAAVCGPTPIAREAGGLPFW